MKVSRYIVTLHNDGPGLPPLRVLKVYPGSSYPGGVTRIEAYFYSWDEAKSYARFRNPWTSTYGPETLGGAMRSLDRAVKVIVRTMQAGGVSPGEEKQEGGYAPEAGADGRA